MLLVIKRKGGSEPFDPEKIKASLAAASDELKQPLSKSDISHLAEAISSQFDGREKISSHEVYQTLVHTLEEEGFTCLANLFQRYVENHWKD